MGLERSQLFPEIFEIVLRPFWWAAGSEQPSPPLHRAAAARLLRCFDKYKSFYTRNMIANRRWSGRDGCSLPAAHQNDCSTISNISGNSWDLSSPILGVIGNFTLHWARRSAPHFWEGLDWPHCIFCWWHLVTDLVFYTRCQTYLANTHFVVWFAGRQLANSERGGSWEVAWVKESRQEHLLPA